MPTIFALPTDELMRMANKLIDTYFTDLATKRVDFALIFERSNEGLISAPMSKGKEIWGRTTVISGKNAWLAAEPEQRALAAEPEKFFLIEIVKPIWDNFKEDKRVREALLHHQLMQCDVDLDSGKLSIKPFDVMEFNATLRQYGPWTADIHNFLKAGAAQISLLEMMEASADDDVEMFDRVEVPLADGSKTQVCRADLITWWNLLEKQREFDREYARAEGVNSDVAQKFRKHLKVLRKRGITITPAKEGSA